MTKEEHIERHRILHDALDELLADYIKHAPSIPWPSEVPIIELCKWSAKQAKNPDHDPNKGNI